MPFRLLFTVLLLSSGSNMAAEKPNIVLFMADDMGMGDTSAYQDFTKNADDVQIRTPSMERLASKGIRFTDAHTPSSRCSPTRYGLLTGRYPWRNRLKYWVLFGSQGDPMIEADRPTLATLLKEEGYKTGMFGKWHVGLRYHQTDGRPAAGWEDADLTKPLHTGPVDYGFDVVKFTSRSHGTSGVTGKKNGPSQSVGPGHIDGRTILSATGNGKELYGKGHPEAYVLEELGGRHSDNAMAFLKSVGDHPFFLYYPSNSNHSPYTVDEEIGGVPVAGASRTVSGKPMDSRHDFVYENDVALGRLMDYLDATDDPRNPGAKLAENTIVIFTSDNGAEINSDVASGPFRSHKGSTFEGGHRVPFIVSWPAGGIGHGETSAIPIGLQDVFATFSEIIGRDLPDLLAGEKGGEDSTSMLAAWRGEELPNHPPLFFNDHKQAKPDNAVAAMRFDEGEHQWKIFFSAKLLREGVTEATDLYDLASDQMEENNRISEPDLSPLVERLKAMAIEHRTSGGHRYAKVSSDQRVTFDWKNGATALTSQGITANIDVEKDGTPVDAPKFHYNPRGLGVEAGGKLGQVESGEALVFRFDQDVIVESVAIIAGNGVCGGYYQVGDDAPMAIYCVDADNDSKEQQGILSDIGMVKKGEALRLDSRPHLGVEAAGQWRLQSLIVRPVAH